MDAAETSIANLIAACEFPDRHRAAWAMVELMEVMKARRWHLDLATLPFDDLRYSATITVSELAPKFFGHAENPMKAVAIAARDAAAHRE